MSCPIHISMIVYISRPPLQSRQGRATVCHKHVGKLLVNSSPVEAWVLAGSSIWECLWKAFYNASHKVTPLLSGNKNKWKWNGSKTRDLYRHQQRILFHGMTFYGREFLWRTWQILGCWKGNLVHVRVERAKRLVLLLNWRDLTFTFRGQCVRKKKKERACEKTRFSITPQWRVLYSKLKWSPTCGRMSPISWRAEWQQMKGAVIASR